MSLMKTVERELTKSLCGHTKHILQFKIEFYNQ